MIVTLGASVAVKPTGPDASPINKSVGVGENPLLVTCTIGNAFSYGAR